jgi:soluble lytic murein transglycosylase-like protein
VRRPHVRRGFRAEVTPARLRMLLIAVAALFLFPSVRHVSGRGWDAVREVVRAERAGRVRHAQVAEYARRYGIRYETADAVERAARAEGVDVDLAFRLVRVESGFRADAVSSAGALGMTQLMPVTARDLQPGITREQLLEPETNLRLGFRYLRTLLRVYGGDREEALHAYNRGIGTVARIRAAGGDPANGYATRVLGDGGRSPVSPAAGQGRAAGEAEGRLHEMAPVPLPVSP